MPRFIERFNFVTHPFEKYVAENEPHIQDYAVVPPYFEETRKRTISLSSYILFGYRGSGKSATRITNERSIWGALKNGETAPLIISLTNFDPIIDGVKIEDIKANRIIAHVAFLAMESMLLWMSNQEEQDEFFDLLNDDERREFMRLVKAHYLSVPDSSRKLSVKRTMQVLNQTWYNRTIYWMEKRWEPISSIVAKVTSKGAQKYADLDDVAAEMHEILRGSPSYEVGVAALQDVVSCARFLGFSGVCVYVDKVDETSKTSVSSAAAAQLVYPILSQVQLMEIDGFAWIFFLWDKVRGEYGQNSGVRLDKLPYSEISWEVEFLIEMVNRRLRHFSEERIVSGRQICDESVDFDEQVRELVRIVSRSPRELMRLLDVLVREYDVKYASQADSPLLTGQDFEDAVNSYIRDTVWNAYDRKYLSQILRLEMEKFMNKDVQSKFKISDQSARNWIRNWVSCGAVRQSGTTVGESESSGKPANVYAISDPRISLMRERGLYDGDALIVEIPVADEE